MENQDKKIKDLKDAILHHENTIDRIDEGTTTFLEKDRAEARAQAEKMINQYQEIIDSLEKEKKQ